MRKPTTALNCLFNNDLTEVRVIIFSKEGMRMKMKLSAVCLLIGSLIVGLGNVSAMPVLPDFSAATFLSGASVDHPYFFSDRDESNV